MAGRVGGYLRNNVLGLVAIFIALGAGAYAAGLPKNSVGTKQLKNNAVVSEKVEDGSLLGADFAAGQLPQGQQGAQGETGPAGSPDTSQQVLDKLEQVDGVGSGLDADTVAGIAGGELGTAARYASGSCSDDAHAPQASGGATCVTVPFTLPRSRPVLLIGNGFMESIQTDDTTGAGAGSDDPGFTLGDCALWADDVRQGNVINGKFLHSGEDVPLSLLAVTQPLSAGSHTFQMRCSELDGDIDFSHLGVAAVMLGSG
jgi:hypothetical protein